MDSPFEVTVKTARKRGHYLLVSRGDHVTAIHSRYDPVKQAEEWAGRIADQFNKILLVGGGLGYFARALEEADVTCSIVDCLPEFEVPEETPLGEFRRRNDFLRFDLDDEPVQILDRLPAEAVNKAKVILHPGYEHLVPEHEKFVGSLHVMSRGKLRNVQTRFRFMNRELSNIIEILPEIESIHPIGQLKNMYANQPGVLVGAGPSLSEGFGWLKKYQDNLLVVVVDSAVSALRKMGIRPDFTITIDPQQDNASYIDGVQPGPVAGALTATPEYFRWASGSNRFGFCLANDAGGERLISEPLQWLRSFFEGSGSLQSGGSIATTSIDFFRLLGIDPVIITGVDHCFTDHRAVAGGTKREEFFLNSLNRFETLATKHLDWIFSKIPDQGKQLKLTETRNGNAVYTMDEYEVQNNWFEQASTVLGSRCLDFRSDGMEMKGWEVIASPDRYLEENMTEPVPDIPATNLSTYSVDWEGLSEATKKLHEDCPNNPGEFESTVRSEEHPDNDFWNQFVSPLDDFSSMNDYEVSSTDISEFHEDLKRNLNRLNEVVQEKLR